MPLGGPARVAVFAECDCPRQLTALLGPFESKGDALPLRRQRTLEPQPVAGARAGEIARGEFPLRRTVQPPVILLENEFVFCRAVHEIERQFPNTGDVR